MTKNRAVPLCLPNNYQWDEKSGVYSKEEDKSRISLCVIDAALRKLRQIKGNPPDKLTWKPFIPSFCKVSVTILRVTREVSFTHLHDNK